MVVNTAMGWLSEVGDNLKRSLLLAPDSKKSTTIGILSFETAKAMSRLVSLYKSLHDNEISKLRKHIIKSEGVSYLNSRDESYLLSLACAERLEDLDISAATVARLGLKCNDFGLSRFELVYSDLKLGVIDLGKREYGSRETERTIEKMEKYVTATSRLYAALEGLSELEVSERKIKQWKESTSKSVIKLQPTPNFDMFNHKIAYQRKQVRHYRQTSLWSQSFERSLGLMAKMICVVYARIAVVFGRNILNNVVKRGKRKNNRSLEQQIISRSGPIMGTPRSNLVRFPSQNSSLFSSGDSVLGSNNRVFHAAAPSTLGGSGLALRYANIILLAEKYLDSKVTIGEDARQDMYMMLPENLKGLVRSKLSKNIRPSVSGQDDESLAEGWKEALRVILRWLVPMANDTVKWQTERNVEKMKFESKPLVLLLQTLHFADREKAEAAIAEVLVGLSCVYRFENRGNCCDGGGGGGSRVGGCAGDAIVVGRCSFDGVTWS